MKYLAQYGTEGPFGIPMKDAQAKALEALLQSQPDLKDSYVRRIVEKGMTELGEREDVSWITTQAVDRHKDVVLTAGIDETHYKANPLVTLGHYYHLPPVGRSLWRKRVTDGSTIGLKAKTYYPPRPEGWTQQDWMPDVAFNLVKAGLMPGKSIGFLPIEAGAPTPDEIRKNPEWADAWRIVRRCLLVEYSCHWLPVNQQALVEQVSKGLSIPGDVAQVLGLDLKALQLTPPPPTLVVHTPLAEIEKAITRQLTELDIPALVEKSVQDSIARMQGRV